MNTQNILDHNRLRFQQSCVEHEEDKQTQTPDRMGRKDDRDLQHK